MNEDIVKTGPETIDVAALLKQSWDYLFRKPVEHIFGALLVMLLGSLTLGVLIGPLMVGYIRMIDKQRRGEPIAVGDVFNGFESFGSAFLVVLLWGLGIGLGLPLLVLPGLFLMVAWGFALWFVALKGQGSTDALGSAWQLLKTHAGSVVVIFLVAIVLNSLGSGAVLGTLLTVPFTTIFITLGFYELSD